MINIVQSNVGSLILVKKIFISTWTLKFYLCLMNSHIIKKKEKNEWKIRNEE